MGKRRRGKKKERREWRNENIRRGKGRKRENDCGLTV